MSTRSRIGIVNADKTITSIYCHHDGYLGWTGVRLLASYDTEEKIRELLALGDLSALGHEIGKKHIYLDSGTDEFCFAYKRDAGRGDCPSQTTSRKKFLDMREEYTYLFDKGEWKVQYDGSTWKPLDLEVIADRITS